MRWVNVHTLFLFNKCRGYKLRILKVESFDEFCDCLKEYGSVFFYSSGIGNLYLGFFPSLFNCKYIPLEVDYRARGMNDVDIPKFCATDLLRCKKKLRSFYYDLKINPFGFIMFFSKE